MLANEVIIIIVKATIIFYLIKYKKNIKNIFNKQNKYYIKKWLK